MNVRSYTFYFGTDHKRSLNRKILKENHVSGGLMFEHFQWEVFDLIWSVFSLMPVNLALGLMANDMVRNLLYHYILYILYTIYVCNFSQQKTTHIWQWAVSLSSSELYCMTFSLSSSQSLWVCWMPMCLVHRFPNLWTWKETQSSVTVWLVQFSWRFLKFQ